MVGIEAQWTHSVSLGWSLFDSEILTSVGRETMWVYLGLCRFIWRMDQGEDLDLCELYAQGMLVSCASQARIGRALGMQRETVNRHLKKLRKIGWVIPVKRPSGRLFFHLGNWTKAAGSKKVEALLSTPAIQRAYDRIGTKAPPVEDVPENVVPLDGNRRAAGSSGGDFGWS